MSTESITTEKSTEMNHLVTTTTRILHALFTDETNTTLTPHYHRPLAGRNDNGYTNETALNNSFSETANNSHTNRQTITFTLIFLTLMFLYIGFCYHYRKVKITWISRSSTDTAADRARRARDNAAVLTESRGAAQRAAEDEEEERKLNERKDRIDRVLWSRLIVEDEESGVNDCRNVAQDECVLEKEEDATLKEEATIVTVTSSSSTDDAASNNDIHLSTSHNNSCTQTALTKTITLSQIQQTYSTECNICLSAFQSGQRAAWSKHHFNGCVHVFHEDCMKRWLLVRDGCPICRRKFLIDDKVDLESGVNETVDVEEG